VDALAGLLDGPRARGAFLLRCLLDPPWCLRIEDEAPLSLTAVARGHAQIRSDDGVSTALGPGDVVIARGPRPYTVADPPGTPPHAIIRPGPRCVALDGHELREEMAVGVRSWGNSTTGETVLLTGAYHLEGEVSRRLVRVLPHLLVLPARDWETPLVPLLAEEIVKDEPGQEAVLDRLLDLLLIAALRTWFARPDTPTPAWYRGYGDPVVGRALRLLQHQPAREWTVASLAAETGVSRAALARRFTELVGEPPMSFLTSWRLALAADLLREPDTGLAAVARQVGYATPYALSTAFKRAHGMSPREYRARSAS
jgi:AraC-like DNA-binding protein